MIRVSANVGRHVNQPKTNRIQCARGDAKRAADQAWKNDLGIEQCFADLIPLERSVFEALTIHSDSTDGLYSLFW